MRTYVEIEMVRDQRGVWVAPWELWQQPASARGQEGKARAEGKRSTPDPQEKRSRGDMLRALMPAWTEGWAGASQQAT